MQVYPVTDIILHPFLFTGNTGPVAGTRDIEQTLWKVAPGQSSLLFRY